jgi:hypothetical protein
VICVPEQYPHVPAYIFMVQICALIRAPVTSMLKVGNLGGNYTPLRFAQMPSVQVQAHNKVDKRHTPVELDEPGLYLGNLCGWLYFYFATLNLFDKFGHPQLQYFLCSLYRIFGYI